MDSKEEDCGAGASASASANSLITRRDSLSLEVLEDGYGVVVHEEVVECEEEEEEDENASCQAEAPTPSSLLLQKKL